MPSTPILLGTYEPYSIGERHHADFYLDPAQHTYIIGASGSGKTHLLRNILIQMIASGEGVGFCDPHGDLADELLDHIPPERIKDVCYFNPADLRFPVAWNPLGALGDSYASAFWCGGRLNTCSKVPLYFAQRRANI
jgi:DNA helicase HerA-like ATPase